MKFLLINVLIFVFICYLLLVAPSIFLLGLVTGAGVSFILLYINVKYAKHKYNIKNF